MDHSIIALYTLLFASAWASGLNVYAVLLVLGIGGVTGNIDLPETLAVLENPVVIFAVGFMYLVEFGADKIPGVDSTWDFFHTFIRVPAGAMLAGAFMDDISSSWVPVAYVVGGFLALASHGAKSSARLLINTSPEPFSNWAASISEDVLVFTGLWLALVHPYLFLLLLIGFTALVIWLIPKIFRLLGSIISTIVGWFSGQRSGQT